MKTFGDTPIEFRSSIDGRDHVLVAVRGGWQDLCRARPDRYETVELDPKPTEEAVVWRYDRARVTCEVCVVLLDGARLEFPKVPS